MPSRLVATIAASGLIITVGLASHASAFSESIPIKISLLKWGGDPLQGKLYKIVSKPGVTQSGGLFQVPDHVTSDPVTNGGALRVEVGEGGTNGTLECTLAAGAFDGTVGWKALGKPAGSKGYKYINKLEPSNHPCKIAIIKDKVIKVLAKSVGDIDPPLSSGNPDVYVFLTAGTDDYCAKAEAPHEKEKANSLIKMKDEVAPATCQRCGDGVVNLPGEECDGTDDSACPGYCIPRGGGGGICGDNLRNTGAQCECATEECDGTDSPACPGLCLANCTCPKQVCNNGVKEVGEECDPAGSTADCPVGEICGGFCECVPNVPCDCGSPDPTLYMYRNEAPVPGSVCGTTDGETLQNLECGTLGIGGGGGALPVTITIPDQATPKYNVIQCVGSDLTLAPTTKAQVGARNCTEGRRCVGGSKDGEPCIRSRECAGGRNCVTRCWFGSYLSILNLDLPVLSTCVSNEFSVDAKGGVDCDSGRSFTRVPLDSGSYLTLRDQSPSTPGYQPCPICLGGTLDVPNSGTCEGGPNKNLPCMPMSTSYDLYDCCTGGQNNAKPCSDDSDCPGSTCVSGCTIYPTSLDCPPNPAGYVCGAIQFLPLTTEANQVTADERGSFCGWCRDVLAEGSLCFEGDDDPDGADLDHLGDKFCPDSAIVACRPSTYWSNYPNGDPADLAACGDALSCRTDADCTAPYETCTQRTPGAWRDATVRTITYVGARSESLTDHAFHYMEVAGSHCIPPAFYAAIDANADLGGPGGVSLVGVARVSPSGAFLEAAAGVLD